ncbi:MAG: NUDIX hydrolase [Hyphococcus sp.]|nr:MAG: NUDIX hydrolase [Marinicaulis sp.]
MTDSLKNTPQFVQEIPPGDDRERAVCTSCGFIDYQNPKIVVGSVALWEDKILLCKRAIEPRKGYWTLPAGYLEVKETPEEGAVREAWEEARARLHLERLLAIYSVPRISQVQLMYRARLASPEISAGPESEAVALYDWDDIPWADMAFPSAGWALRHYRESMGKNNFAPFTNPEDGL